MKNSLTLSYMWISIYLIVYINYMIYKYFILAVCFVQGSNFGKHPWEPVCIGLCYRRDGLRLEQAGDFMGPR